MPERTLLDALLDVIDAATDDGWDQPATLWFAAADPTGPDPNGITIGHKVVDGHPFHHLLGFTAPDDWTVLGVTCCGWAGSTDADVPPSMQEGRRRVRQTFLVGRSGATASVVRFRDGGEPQRLHDPAEGRMVDALRRAFALPTQPPETETCILFIAWWLANVVSAGRTAPKRLTWKRVCDQHPAVRLLRAAGQPAITGDPVAAGRTLADVFDWTRLRELLVETSVPGSIDPGLAAWMDEGMLSRYLLAELPTIGTLLVEALGHATPATGSRLLIAVRSLLTSRAAA
jgi:hypothetical protein